MVSAGGGCTVDPDCYSYANAFSAACCCGCPGDFANTGRVSVGVAIHPLLGVLFGLSAQVGILVIYVRALGLTGQTWGRKLAGVMVVGEKTGQPIGIGGAVLQCLVEWLVSGSVLSLGYFWMLWDDNKQTWHDKDADSVVIKV